MQLLRKIFFYIFAAIYITVCPLVIMYALGYIYQPGSSEGIVTTGLIYLSTAPSGATVYMNGSRFTQDTPTVIRDLLPGDYSIKLTKRGYRSWGRDLKVRAEKATVFDKVLLLPEKWQTTEAVHGKFDNLVPIEGTDRLLLVKGPTLGDVVVYDTAGDKSWPLLEKGSEFSGYKPERYFTVKESSALLVSAQLDEGTKYLWVILGNGENTVSDLTVLFQITPESVRWGPGRTDQIFSYSGGKLSRIDIKQNAVYPSLAAGLKGFGVTDSHVYLMTSDGLVQKADYTGKNKTTLLNDQVLGAGLFGGKFYSIRREPSDIILFLGSGGELIANRLPYTFADKGARGGSFYDEEEKALFWKKDRIGVIDFAAERTGNVQFEKGASLTWVYTGGKNISQAFWVYEASHLLFRDGGEISLAEIDPDGKVLIRKVFRSEEKIPAYYSEDTGTVYFLAKRGKSLFAVTIVPQQGLIQVPFPDLDHTGGTK